MSDPSPETLPSGQKMFGKYRAFATLGSGGMGDVFLALARGRQGVNKLVVIKALKRDFAREPDAVDRARHDDVAEDKIDLGPVGEEP